MFITHGPLDPTTHVFVGRKADLKQMQTWLTEISCVGTILGARQTGKTSLLYQLRHQLQAKYKFVFINLESIAGEDLKTCYTYIATELLEELGELLLDFNQPLPTTNHQFQVFLRQIAKKSRVVRIAIILDEVGALPHDTISPLAHTIRAIFTNRIVKPELKKYLFMLSGAVDMLALTKGNHSPLVNVTESIYLSDFSSAEVEHLVTTAFTAVNLVCKPSLLADIYTWTNGHPYFTQLLGSQLLNLHYPLLEPLPESMADIAIADLVEAILCTEDKNLPHVRRNLDDASPKLWETIKKIINTGPIPFSRSNKTLAQLELMGLIKQVAGQSHIRNKIYHKAIEQWLLEEITLSVNPLTAIQRSQLKQRLQTLANPLDMYNKRIAALQKQISQTLDKETVIILEARLSETTQKQTALEAEIATLERRLTQD